MQYKDYLHFHGEYTPSIDFSKKVQLNPKIFKLSKLFSKKSMISLEEIVPRRRSVDSNTKMHKKSSAASQEPMETSGKSKFSHLPQLPPINEASKRSTYIFHNYKLIQKLPKVKPEANPENKNKVSEKAPLIKPMNALHNFEFSEIEKFRANSISKFSMKNDESNFINAEEKNTPNRKVIYSKKSQNKNVEAKDFSCFFDFQDTHRTYNTSFSNFNS